MNDQSVIFPIMVGQNHVCIFSADKIPANKCYTNCKPVPIYVKNCSRYAVVDRV
jgi:hypothetical protein